MKNNLRFISRYPSGYMVRYTVKSDVIFQKNFGIKIYGTLDAALDAALAYRNEKIPEKEVIEGRKFKKIRPLDPRNTTGVSGVTRCVSFKQLKSGGVTISTFYNCAWSEGPETSGPRKQRRKCFGFDVNDAKDEQRALDAAIAHRRRKEAEHYDGVLCS